MLVPRGADDETGIALIEGLRRARDDFRKEVAAHVRDSEPDQAGPPIRQRPRVAVTDVAQLADVTQHPLAGGGRHVRPAIEHARDRGNRDPRQGGDILDRRARALRPHPGRRDTRSCGHTAGPPRAVSATGFYTTISAGTGLVKAYGSTGPI